tara:strand:+ start:566 stop:1423 length:858 start_codon:yes stop_codon:yes gene_type:complete
MGYEIEAALLVLFIGIVFALYQLTAKVYELPPPTAPQNEKTTATQNQSPPRATLTTESTKAEYIYDEQTHVLSIGKWVEVSGTIEFEHGGVELDYSNLVSSKRTLLQNGSTPTESKCHLLYYDSGLYIDNAKPIINGDEQQHCANYATYLEYTNFSHIYEWGSTMFTGSDELESFSEEVYDIIGPGQISGIQLTKLIEAFQRGDDLREVAIENSILGDTPNTNQQHEYWEPHGIDYMYSELSRLSDIPLDELQSSVESAMKETGGTEKDTLHQMLIDAQENTDPS